MMHTIVRDYVLIVYDLVHEYSLSSLCTHQLVVRTARTIWTLRLQIAGLNKSSFSSCIPKGTAYSFVEEISFYAPQWSKYRLAYREAKLTPWCLSLHTWVKEIFFDLIVEFHWFKAKRRTASMELLNFSLMFYTM